MAGPFDVEVGPGVMGATCALTCLDLAGTTVADDNMVERAFAEAVATQGIVPGTAAYARAMVQIHRSRGLPKIEILRGLFPEDEARAQAVNVAFERSYGAAIDREGLTPIPGAEECMGALADAGVRICFVTGFSRATLGRVLDALGWWNRADLALSPDDAGRGRPYPDVILTAVLRLGIADVREVAVVGDTDSDIIAGRRAGAATLVGVRTGAHEDDRLRAAGATHVIDSVAELPELILESRGASTVSTASLT